MKHDESEDSLFLKGSRMKPGKIDNPVYFSLIFLKKESQTDQFPP